MSGQKKKHSHIFAVYEKLFVTLFEPKITSLLLATLYFHSFFPEASLKHFDLGDPERLKQGTHPPNSLAWKVYFARVYFPKV